jgi:hypothetical protein
MADMTDAALDVAGKVNPELAPPFRKRKRIQGLTQKLDKMLLTDVGEAQILLAATLNASRLASWGFLAESQAQGVETYRVNEVLDGRCCPFCRMMHGKEFNVASAADQVNRAVRAQDPDDVKSIMPWPKTDRASMESFGKMSAEELQAAGYQVPPFHPECRGVLSSPDEEVPDLERPEVENEDQSLPTQTSTLDTFEELGIDMDAEDVDLWNSYVKLSPVEVLSELGDKEPQEVMEGVFGPSAIQVSDNGDISTSLAGENDGVKYETETVLNPYTGELAITQADMTSGNEQDQMAFIRHFFSAAIAVGVSSAASKLLVQVPDGQATDYLKLGFAPDQDSWDEARAAALENPDLRTLSSEDYVVVSHLLQDNDPATASILADLAIECNGVQIGDWVLAGMAGKFALDLTDDDAVTQARTYLGDI